MPSSMAVVSVSAVQPNSPRGGMMGEMWWLGAGKQNGEENLIVCRILSVLSAREMKIRRVIVSIPFRVMIGGLLLQRAATTVNGLALAVPQRRSTFVAYDHPDRRR